MRIALGIFIIFLLGCGNVNKTNLNTWNINNINIEDYNLEFTIDSICNSTEKYTGYVYLLNADCSICLSTFFDFISKISDTDRVYPVSIIVDDGYKEIVKYYTSQMNTNNEVDLLIFENTNNKFVKSDLISYGDIVLFFENNILKDSFIYQQ